MLIITHRHSHHHHHHHQSPPSPPPVGKIDSDLGKFMIAAATVHDILLWLLVTVLFGLVDSPDNWAGQSAHPPPSPNLTRAFMLKFCYK